jgi:hypothetical protein
VANCNWRYLSLLPASANAGPGHLHQAGVNPEKPPAAVVQPAKLVLEGFQTRAPG